jgi:hypothetical protein
MRARTKRARPIRRQSAHPLLQTTLPVTLSVHQRSLRGRDAELFSRRTRRSRVSARYLVHMFIIYLYARQTQNAAIAEPSDCLSRPSLGSSLSQARLTKLVHMRNDAAVRCTALRAGFTVPPRSYPAAGRPERPRRVLIPTAQRHRKASGHCSSRRRHEVRAARRRSLRRDRAETTGREVGRV